MPVSRLEKNARGREWYRLNHQSTTTSTYRIMDWMETHGEQSMRQLDDGISSHNLIAIRRVVARMVKDGRMVKVTHRDVFGLLPMSDRYTYRLPE